MRDTGELKRITKLPDLHSISQSVRQMSQEEFDALLEEILIEVRTRALAEAENGGVALNFEAELPLMLREKRNRHVLDSKALAEFKAECEEVNVYVAIEPVRQSNILSIQLSW